MIKHIPIFFLIITGQIYGQSFSHAFSSTDSIGMNGCKYISWDINFTFDQATFLNNKSVSVLDSIGIYLKINSNIAIEIGVHSGLRGSDRYNDSITLKRAEAIRDYMNGKGVPKNQLTVKGYGRNQPLVKKDNDEKGKKTNCENTIQDKNIRVEFKILNLFCYPELPQSYTTNDYELKPYHAGKYPKWERATYRFYGIHFRFDSDSLFKESYTELDSIAEWLNHYPEVIIQVGVHLDTRWSDEYSSSWSSRRAQKITKYLMSKGVAADRLFPMGYRDKEPIFPETYTNTIRGTKLEEDIENINRRVQILIMN